MVNDINFLENTTNVGCQSEIICKQVNTSVFLYTFFSLIINFINGKILISNSKQYIILTKMINQ